MSTIHKCDVVSSFGRKGTGKSELARYLWSLFAPPRVCIDPKDEHGPDLPGVPSLRSPSPREVLEHQTVRVVPPIGDPEHWYSELYLAAYQQGDINIWCDELNVVTNPNKIPEGMRTYVLRGRARLCGHLGCSPRPASVHGDFISQADHVLVHRIRHIRDREAIARHFDVSLDELTRLMDELEKFGFLHYDAESGDIETSSPVHDPEALTAELARLYFGPYDAT